MPKASAQPGQQPTYQYDTTTGKGPVSSSLNRRLLTVAHPDQYRVVSSNPADASDGVPMLDVRTKHKEEEIPLKDEDLILASPIVYGFSLSDKIWRTSPAHPFSLRSSLLTLY